MTDAEISPQMARSVEASAERWRQVMKDYRFLTRAELDGMRAGRVASHLLKVEHDGASLYPEFQFNAAGELLPVIPELMNLAKSNDWSEQSLILWLVTPTGYFDDEAPIKHLDEWDRILAGASSRFEQSW
jgi:hypothetical protein